MRQRNETGTIWHFASTPATDDQPEQPPYSVEPGDTTDYPNLLDGWTAVEDTEAAPPKGRSKKTANSTDDTEGGESQ
ncbi:hypothetical protein OS965_02550 [Streptomyces sp. H27-G5]|uniref:hypothetical protein n=1 Tax=Streptomyces sp. H27-G5 TaxID=2996698 RepID=UPI0022708B96|nr:hypothetical protein [Streptomyces sp. H27-G5]MCY0917057.1 hypothetical protein [Streptomyces sp. H27-G5]